jgi:hypothetical protein
MNLKVEKYAKRKEGRIEFEWMLSKKEKKYPIFPTE